ncbi:aminoglycoside N(3)-acetyltransferase [Streptomyces sp. NRRL WC-3742]|uniref:aminoglycoside N(3)-acetyltransferase n=1 Tax=Streptomyces sp. NRRL WC-3742 TaxID=1463934 RepID=UPI0004CB9380|nr:AAC(3) family N-acetyltransferase [Streptomyces sp. NRRL WC-3742]
MLTVPALVSGLTDLGVRPGTVLHVQASLRSLGPVEGGAGGVVDALLEVLGPDGTLVAYTATPENSSTSRIHRNAVAGLTPEEAELHRAGMPRFDPATTPASPTVGALSEAIRTRPGALRSSHPQTSWAALGRHAREITAAHPLTSHLGPESPLGRLYDLDARVLMLGVPMDHFTAFHLADLRRPGVALREYRCVGEEGWVAFRAPDLDDLHFGDLGARLFGTEPALAATRPLGGTTARLIPVRPAVDIAEHLLTA